MSGENQEIKIVGVDKEAIKVSTESKDLWIVPFKLSQKPDSSWERKFYETQQKDRSLMRRKARVIEDSLTVEVAAVDDLQKVLDVLKTEVTETNAVCEEELQRKMKIRKELEDLQQRQRDASQKLKDDSDNLKF